MRQVLVRKTRLRLLGSVVIAGLVSACSSDVARFSDNPFSNPFQSRTSFDPVSTNSISRGKAQAQSQAQTRLAPVTNAATTTQTLPPVSAPMMRTAAASTGVVGSANYPSLVPNAAKNNPIVTGSTNGWTAVGGTPVTLGAGENINTLSSRYGVPASAIMAVNGLSSTNAAQPGQQLMIPAYNAVSGGAPSVAKVASAAKVSSATPAAAAVAAPVAAAAAVKASSTSKARETVEQAKAVVPPSRPAAVRDVTQRAESDAEKRAAAKLAQLRKQEAEADDDEDEKPAKAAPKVDPLKKADAAKKVEDAKKAELKKAEDAKKAELKKAEMKKAEAKKQEELRKAEALKKAEATKKAEAAKKAAKAKQDDDVETTASIPEPKVPAKTAALAPSTPKPVEKVEEATEDKSSASFRWPAQGRVISGFGARNTGGANDGINIALPEGTPVRAAEGGTVVHADDALKGYGKLVLIRHPNGFVSVYAHNGELSVKRGESVKRGQVIAKSGQSGNVTSPQLHFEIRKGATPVDPAKMLANN